MRNDRQAYQALETSISKVKQAERIMSLPKSFAFRLAALNAADTNPGKHW